MKQFLVQIRTFLDPLIVINFIRDLGGMSEMAVKNLCVGVKAKSYNFGGNKRVYIYSIFNEVNIYHSLIGRS